jgi:hypothetical protein
MRKRSLVSPKRAINNNTVTNIEATCVEQIQLSTARKDQILSTFYTFSLHFNHGKQPRKWEN